MWIVPSFSNLAKVSELPAVPMTLPALIDVKLDESPEIECDRFLIPCVSGNRGRHDRQNIATGRQREEALPLRRRHHGRQNRLRQIERLARAMVKV